MLKNITQENLLFELINKHSDLAARHTFLSGQNF